MSRSIVNGPGVLLAGVRAIVFGVNRGFRNETIPWYGLITKTKHIGILF